MARELDLFRVHHSATIRDAMERIEANKHRVVIVVDDEGRVLGTVSDGDVRRAFLHDALPITPVTRIMQLNPRVITESEQGRGAEALKEKHVTVLPVVSDDNRLVDVLLAYEPLVE
jgi:CBS domain-containing protein